ncbi:calreticulin family protein [Zalerion maritima]|uniref:Calreticulin family protein n=1 Tax=Zalerion maritima TaxID=339359 RepID=A0AAD5WX29_9PEZI|nr:calreticulin family protein [Zalerion maritima]
MRFNIAAAAISAAVLSGNACADEAHKPLKDESSESSTKVAPSMATFTPTSIKADFLEQFTSDWDSRWKPSHAKKDNTGDEEWAYVGEWSVEEPHVYKGMEGDEGLVVKNPAAHHAISAKFPQAIDNTDKTLVVQYEVKLQKGLECGGAYLKLLRENADLHSEEFSNATPYVIMFGPDKCGHTNKVHFIFNHKNPKTGEYEEKHLVSPPTARIVKTTELYTLIVNPDNTYVIKQDNEEVKSGSLFEDFSPAINPSAEIDDPNDSKPENWVDEARIPDPEAAKPEDWDEEAPFEIVDDEAEQPEDWLVDEPLSIPDPEAEKPEDWDEEEDGDWIAPTVPNSKCAEASGCGPWTKPMKRNPDYKGKWTAPYIDNPDYKGVWAPQKIANPDFFEDKTPSNFEPMGAIGFEIWTMQNDILFDNIYIGHSVEDADKLAQESFHVKHLVEKELELADKPKPKDKKGVEEPSFKEDPVAYIKEKLDLFFTIAQNDPIGAIKFVPEAAGGLAAVFLTVVGIIVAVVAGGSSAAPAAKKAAGDLKEKAKEVKEEAKATGADTGKGATKRAGKGQS